MLGETGGIVKRALLLADEQRRESWDGFDKLLEYGGRGARWRTALRSRGDERARKREGTPKPFEKDGWRLRSRSTRTLVPGALTGLLTSAGFGRSSEGPLRGVKEQLSAVGLRELHEKMSGYVERGEVPGLATLVSRDDQTSVDALGVRSIGWAGHQAVQRDTIFRIASMTKAITGVATMMLVEAGKLKLDEPVDRLLPELAKRRVLKRVDAPARRDGSREAGDYGARLADVSTWARIRIGADR